MNLWEGFLYSIVLAIGLTVAVVLDIKSTIRSTEPLVPVLEIKIKDGITDTTYIYTIND